MIFKSFTFEPCLYGGNPDAKVNNFIAEHEKLGYVVVDKLVLGGRQGDNSLIKAVVTITIWMDKEPTNE